MANVRQAQLLEQRNRTRNLYSGSRIRLLSPANTAISSIAKRTATNELDAMVQKYNAGEVGNDEMRSFLVKMQNNPSLPASDKLDINKQISDFDSRIQKDKLEAVYKAAPDNTLSQLQAAQALSNYYKNRAAGMAQDTPAQSDLLTTAAQYDQKIADIQNNIQRVARQNQRYSAEQRINQLPNNSSDRSMARAQMYKSLYDQAVADGDPTDANKYAAAYQQEVTNAQAQADNEAQRASKEQIDTEKQTLRDYMGSLVNDYHDGRITEQQYLQALSDISPRVDATNDYGLINSLNRTTDIIQKNLDKGGLRRGATANGLPTVLGKGKGGGVGGVVTNWDQQDFNYSDNLRALQEAFNQKKLTPQQYVQAFQVVVAKRAEDLQTQIDAVEQTAQENPNAKVVYNGKKTRAADVLDSLYKEQDSLDKQAGAVLQGDPKKLVLVMKAPKTTNGFSTYEVANADTLQNDGKYAMDSSGIYHEILKKQIQLTDRAAIQQALQNGGYYTDQNGNSYKVTIDKNGRAFYNGGDQYVKVYDAHSAQSYDAPLGQDGTVASFSDYQKQLEQQARDATSSAKLKKPTAPVVEKPGGDLLSQAKQVGTQIVGAIPQANPVIGGVVNAAKAAGNVVNEVVNSEKNRVVSPLQPQSKPANEVGVTQSTPIALPKQSVQVPQPTQTALPPVKMPTLYNAGQPVQTPIQKAAATGQLPKNVPIQAPPKTSAAASQQATRNVLNNQYSVSNSLKALGKNILGFFGFR